MKNGHIFGTPFTPMPKNFLKKLDTASERRILISTYFTSRELRNFITHTLLKVAVKI